MLSVVLNSSLPLLKLISRLAVSLAFGLLVANLKAEDGYWIRSGNGSWTAPDNWDSATIADGPDDTAYFGILADVPANMTVTLDGPRTIGNLFFTDQTGANNIVLSPGTGGPLTLNATFDTPSIYTALAAQQVTINLPLAGTDGMEKLGEGTLVLTATNTYTGQTIVSDGLLRIDGRIGADGVTVQAGALGGTGVINGPVSVQTGATLSPGGSLSILIISNSLALQPGSRVLLEINAGTGSHDSVFGVSTLTYGGTLIVSNLAGTPALGQSFPLFNATSATGNFTNITPALAGGLRWKFDPAVGALSVVSSNSQPVIAGIALLSASTAVLRVMNGPPGATAYLLGTTNLIIPRTNWLRLSTNSFDLSGSFNVTNAISPATLQRFYSVLLPPGL